MGLLEDLNSGKYNLVLFSILFIFIFHQYWGSSRFMMKSQCKEEIKESMADVSNDIKEAVKQVYLADVEAIRNLSEVATKLNNKEGVTVPGNLTVSGAFNYLPKGTIVMWNGSSAPSGWTLCDGSNGSPDLKNKFVLGWGNRGISAQGGEENVTLSVAQMPQHNHGASVSDPGHTHDQLNGQDRNWRDGTGGINAARMSSGNYGGTVIKSNTTGINVGISNTGSSQAHNNMPPFYTLAFIMKL